MKIILLNIILFCIIIVGCNTKKEEEKEDNTMSNIELTQFGMLNDTTSAMIYTLKNERGMSVSISNYGGHILSINVPDKNGKFSDITLGCDSLKQYLEGTPFFGPIVGRFGNRIAKGKFTLDGKEYSLFINNSPNTLHGGKEGFDKKLWAATIIDGPEPALLLKYTSPDMEEGYPGNLAVEVTYTLLKNNSLKIDYKAITDKPTVVNLTNHAYFNLASADGSQNVLNHELTIMADKITPIDANLIPTGELALVKDTPFDFQKSTKIGARLDDITNEQIKFGGGYDHNFVFTDNSKNMKLGAIVYEPTSGRVMEMYTTEPAVQLYTGNFLDGKIKAKNSKLTYGKRTGFCLETQHFPDSPNQPAFPSTVLRPGETYTSSTIYTFSVRN
jgi:aldose 1-epimerase